MSCKILDYPCFHWEKYVARLVANHIQLGQLFTKMDFYEMRKRVGVVGFVPQHHPTLTQECFRNEDNFSTWLA